METPEDDVHDLVQVNSLFKPGTIQPRESKSNQYTQWLYVYAVGGESENSKLFGRQDEDLNRGIPHYFVGASTGVIKNIQFSKTKLNFDLFTVLFDKNVFSNSVEKTSLFLNLKFKAISENL